MRFIVRAVVLLAAVQIVVNCVGIAMAVWRSDDETDDEDGV